MNEPRENIVENHEDELTTPQVTPQVTPQEPHKSESDKVLVSPLSQVMPELSEEEKEAKDKADKRRDFLKNWEPHPERAIFGRKVGRNEKCPCRSGRKFKKCHGKV